MRTISDPDVQALYDEWKAAQPYRYWTPERRAELRVAAEREVAHRRAIEAAPMITAEEWLAAHQRATA